jgi:NADH-quinone oxidoreductase subunit G
LNDVVKGKVAVDFIEVMACPGGCVGGGGQPVSVEPAVRKARTKGLYSADKALQLRRSQDNPYLSRVHGHHGLHTTYTDRSEAFEGEVSLSHSGTEDSVELKVCLGPLCLSRGSDELLNAVVDRIAEDGLVGKVHVVAHTRVDPCEYPVTASIDDEEIHHATVESIMAALHERLEVVRSS